MRVVLVFCEGRHDVVFVKRSLCAVHDCGFLKSRVGDLPSPLGAPEGESSSGESLVARSYQKVPIDERYLSTAELPLFPVFDVDLEAPSGDRYILVRCGSNQQKTGVVRLLDNLDLVLRASPPGVYEIESYAAAFFYDADEDGVDGRVKVFRDTFGEHFGPLDELTGDNWLLTRTVPVGCFIFHSPESQTGSLEEHLAPMVEEFEPQRWQHAAKFIDENKTPDDAVSRNASERWKAIISTTAQFRFPGDPMSMMLDRRGLPPDSFRSQACKDVVHFLTNVPW